MKQSSQKKLMQQMGITFDDLKNIRDSLIEDIIDMEGPYKNMTKKQMEVLIEANGGEAEMRRRMGME